jgi:hypothetical protein
LEYPKLNFLCAISNKKVYGPFFFAESAITGMSYLDTMQKRLMPPAEDDNDDFIHQQNLVPPCYRHLVRVYFSQHLPQQWTGRTIAKDQAFLR